MDFFTLSGVRPQGLFLPAPVVRDDLIRRVQDIGCGAVILLQFDDLGIREILFKVQDVADVRPAPAVDALVVVPHHAQVPALLGQQPDKSILGGVGVLVFVHMDIVEALPVIIQNRRVIHKQLQGPKQQIVKIQGVGRPEPFLVIGKNFMNLLALIILGAFLEPFVRGQHPVLGVGNPGADLLHWHAVFVHAQGFQPVLDDPVLIVLVINGKRTLITQFFDVPPQNAHANRMEGADPHVRGVGPHQLFHPRLHFPGRFVGKGQGQNMPGLHPMVDQIGDAVGQGAGFAAARAGQNQHRPLQRFSGFSLHGIECGQIHHKPSFSSFCSRRIRSIASLYPSAP